MSLTFITRREYVESVSYTHSFEWRNSPGSGFGFPCDASGVIAPLKPAAAANLANCLNGTFDVRDEGVQEYRHGYWESATVRCDCRAVIVLDDSMTNECERCGLLCNGSGQVLAPISQWEAEDRYAVFGPQNYDPEEILV